MRLIDADKLKQELKSRGYKHAGTMDICALYHMIDMADTVDAVCERYPVDTADTAGEWISVADRLPGESGYYLIAVRIWFDLSERYDIAYYVNYFSAVHKKFGAYDWLDAEKAEEWETKDVTHWMPIRKVGEAAK